MAGAISRQRNRHAVERRLKDCNVGVLTQDIQKDILDTLAEMIAALKKPG